LTDYTLQVPRTFVADMANVDMGISDTVYYQVTLCGASQLGWVITFSVENFG